MRNARQAGPQVLAAAELVYALPSQPPRSLRRRPPQVSASCAQRAPRGGSPGEGRGVGQGAPAAAWAPRERAGLGRWLSPGFRRIFPGAGGLCPVPGRIRPRAGLSRGLRSARRRGLISPRRKALARPTLPWPSPPSRYRLCDSMWNTELVKFSRGCMARNPLIYEFHVTLNKM